MPIERWELDLPEPERLPNLESETSIEIIAGEIVSMIHEGGPLCCHKQDFGDFRGRRRRPHARALHGFFHFLLREDVVAAKPARGTRTPTYPKRLTRRKMDGAFVEAEEVVDRG